MGPEPCQYGIGCPFRASYWPIFLLINPTAASNAASISKSEVSSKSASGAGRMGALPREASRSSRRRMSARMASKVTASELALALQKTPFGAHLGAGGDVDLGVGVRADDRADIAPVEHGAARLARRRPAGRRAARRAPPGCGRRWRRRRPPAGCAGAGRRALAGSRLRATASAAQRSSRRKPSARHVARDGAIEQPGVEARQPPMVGDALGQRALARCRRSVDGNDHRADPVACRSGRRCSSISATNSGKLVATMVVSSTVTGVAAGEAHGQERHGDAVVEMRRDRAAAAHLARAAHGERVAFGARR